MANPLQDIFTEEEPNYKGTLHFNDIEKYKEFQELLANLTEELVEIKGVKNIETYIETKSGKYHLDITDGNLTKILISLPHDMIPFEIETNYGKYTFNFNRYFKDNIAILKTDINSIIHVEIEANDNEETFQITSKIELTNAESVETIVKSCNALQYLILRLLNDETEERKTVLESLKKIEDYWNRVNQIEKTVNKNFNPANINDSLEDKINVERVYFLLVERRPIRTNLKNDITVTVTYNKDFKREQLKSGARLAVSQINEEICKIYGEKINFFRMDYVFNAIIDSIEVNDEKQECVIKCKGTETKPIYNVSLGLKSKEEIPNKDFNSRYKEISDAKTFEVLMDELGA